MIKPLAFCSGLLAAAMLLHPQILRASDHADPQDLTNPFFVQPYPEGNITDLHAFTTDAGGRLITDRRPNQPGDRLVVSLCVRRALRPDQIAGLKLEGYQFRIHIDTGAPVRIFDPAKTRLGADYATERAKLDAEVAGKKEGATARRDALISEYQDDKSMQALYGGIIEHPDTIAATAELEFELGLNKDGENSETFIAKHRTQGIAGPVKITTAETPVPISQKDGPQQFEAGVNYFQTGIHDDPFIFPRFFRRNVVAMVASIPMENLPRSNGPILLWATTHKDGKQIDHVGRSLRTQLPRFGYLNDKPPSEQVAAIRHADEAPGVLQDVLATFITPLVAHRHYDFVPDVMIYDLQQPAHFPNGRALEDDVAQALTDAGEPLLLELAYAESNDVPRANKNDKQFSPYFPYLAPRWTMSEVAANAPAGTTMPEVKPPHSAGTVANWNNQIPENPAGLFGVPRRAEPAAISFKSFQNSTWQTFWLLEIFALTVLGLLLIFTLRSGWWRAGVVIVFIIAVCLLQFVRRDNITDPMNPRMMPQPGQKVCRLILGGGIIAAWAVWWLVAIGRRWGAKYAQPEPKYPPMRQELMTGEATSPPLSGESTYAEIQDALFGDPEKTGRYYKEWGEPGQKPLPIYRVTTALLVRGLFRLGKDFAMLSAARRTLKSRADLRWGPDKKGWHRIVHTMGVCLEGTWKIDADPPGGTYTGYFQNGSHGRVIGRYSLGGNEVRNGHKRSLALVGKVFPLHDSPSGPTPRAHFITQEDLGGAYTDSVLDAQFFNSPPVTLLNRGHGVFSFLVVISALMQADKEPAERQLYEIAELEKPAGTATRCPRFMRLTIDRGQNYPTVVGDHADFREEILSLIYKGSGTPRDLVFNIEVSDKGRRTVLQKLKGQEWHRIGRIAFNRAAASHNGDFVVHFHHPAWRKDRNDPSSVARAEHKS